MKSNDAAMTDDDVKALAELKRPLANIELRHPEEVFDMMVARLEPVIRTLSTDNEMLREALDPFTFAAYPDKFQSDDGGCTEVIVTDADVQCARRALGEKP
jgi:hypothetical protein